MFTDTTKAFSLTLFGEGGGDGAGVSAGHGFRRRGADTGD
mgnify:CR=1 FL=1